jgi:cobalt-zinc-cadmium efflux system outer membrane protein
MKNKLFLALILIWVCDSNALAQQLDELYLAAASNSPKVRAAYTGYQSASQNAQKVGPIDPQITAGYFLTPMMMPDGEQRAMFTLMQMFPWFGTLKAERSMQDEMALMKYQDVLMSINSVFAQLRNELIQANLIYTELDILSQRKALLLDLEKLAVSGIESGKGGLSDVLKLKMSMDEIEAEITNIEASKERIMQRIKLLSGLDEISEMTIRSQQYWQAANLDWENLWDENHPQWQAYQIEANALQLQKELIRREGMPMLGLGVNYTLVSPLQNMMDPINPRNLVQPMVTATIPIYRKKIRASQYQTELESKRVKDEKDAFILDLKLALSTIKTEIEQANNNIALLRRQMLRIDDLLSLTRAGIESGDENLADFIELKLMKLETERMLAREKNMADLAVNELKMLFAIDFRGYVPEDLSTQSIQVK